MYYAVDERKDILSINILRQRNPDIVIIIHLIKCLLCIVVNRHVTWQYLDKNHLPINTFYLKSKSNGKLMLISCSTKLYIFLFDKIVYFHVRQNCIFSCSTKLYIFMFDKIVYFLWAILFYRFLTNITGLWYKGRLNYLTSVM